MQSSKQFLIDRILEQARFEGIPLTETEICMLRFAEATSGSTDLEAANIFDRDYNDEEYESKIANLIRHAYERDKQAGRQDAWDDALVRIAGRDLYLNVMIQRSGIEQKSLFGPLGDWRFFLYAVFPWVASLVAAFLVWFSPLGASFIRSDVLRLVIAICILGAPYVLLRISKPKHKIARRIPAK